MNERRPPHLYLALTECGHRVGELPMQGTAASIWREIDRLQAEGGRVQEIRILERVAIEVHRLADALKHAEESEEGAARRRISGLTGDWLAVARLCA